MLHRWNISYGFYLFYSLFNDVGGRSDCIALQGYKVARICCQKSKNVLFMRLRLLVILSSVFYV